MAHLSINLLPPEFTEGEVKRAKFYKIQAIGVLVILFMTFLASLTVALRILQSHNITQAQASLTQVEQKVSDLKTAQASILLLKNRLTVIGKYVGVESPEVFMYKLIEKLIPPSVSITALTIDKNGEAVFIASIPDGQTLDSMITKFISKEENSDKVAQLSIDTLNRGRDGVYRVSIRVKPK